MKKTILLFFLICITIVSAFAQNTKMGKTTGIQFTLDDNTLIFDKATGKKITYAEYQNLVKGDPGSYRLDAVYNEFGEIASYQLRPATGEERSSNISNLIDLTQRPQVGQPIPLFVMKGLDGNTYRSTDLKGKVVVLSFWLKLSRPFWSPVNINKMKTIQKSYQSNPDFIYLGILDESKESLEKILPFEPVPFIPVPDSYSFQKKFIVTSTPSFIVIDKLGNVAAFIEGDEFETLQKVLESIH